MEGSLIINRPSIYQHLPKVRREVSMVTIGPSDGYDCRGTSRPVFGTSLLISVFSPYLVTVTVMTYSLFSSPLWNQQHMHINELHTEVYRECSELDISKGKSCNMLYTHPSNRYMTLRWGSGLCFCKRMHIFKTIYIGMHIIEDKQVRMREAYWWQLYLSVHCFFRNWRFCNLYIGDWWWSFQWICKLWNMSCWAYTLPLSCV